jgi:hypothetical protein
MVEDALKEPRRQPDPALLISCAPSEVADRVFKSREPMNILRASQIPSDVDPEMSSTGGSNIATQQVPRRDETHLGILTESSCW